MRSVNHGTVELLIDETLCEFNVDVSKLGVGSHQKVIVRCLRCGEKFSREFRHIGQRHMCATHITRTDGTKLKWCGGCQSYLTYKCFTKNATRYDNLSSLCKSCLSNNPSRKRSDIKKTNRRMTPKWWFKWSISQKRSDCRKKGIQFDIDYDYLLNQYEAQDGLCYHGKVKLEFGTKSLRSASLERLNPKNGYIKGNVVLACKAMNWAKNSSSTAEFVEFLLDLLNGLAPYVRLETKIIDEKAKLPFRKRTTDAGYDITSIEEVIIPPHGTKNINTGIIVSPPDGHYFTIEGRSSLAMNGVIPFRGTIDATYQGHLMVALTNISDSAYVVKSGDRIAQIVLHPIVNADFKLVEEFSPVENGRAACGFGSTGR